MSRPIKYHLFRSMNNHSRSITIGEYENGFYFIPAAEGQIPPEENVFSSVEEIEIILDDKLEMILPKETEH